MLDRKLAGQINRPLGMPDPPRMRYEAAPGSPWYWSCSARDRGKLTANVADRGVFGRSAERVDHVARQPRRERHFPVASWRAWVPGRAPVAGGGECLTACGDRAR